MSKGNNRTSLLVNKQLPAFVRDEHATFVAFLESYYKFLEQDGEQLYITKNFNNYLDIDQIRDDIAVDDRGSAAHRLREENDYHNFLQKMYDNFINDIPDTVLADRSLMVKHAKEFYRARGSEKSVRYIMRALFGKEVNFYYPKTDILKTSDGKWFIEKSLKVTNIKVDAASNNDAVIHFANTQIYGTKSGATAIVEKVDTYYDKGVLIYELKLSNIYKEFLNSEGVYTHFTEEGVDKYMTADLYGAGVITYIQIITGGAGYTEGTYIPVISSVGTGAQVVVSKVSKGSVQAAGFIQTGAGFRVDDGLVIVGSGSGASGHISEVDQRGYYHPNSYNVVWSTINLEANTAIGNNKYSNLSSTVDPGNEWITNSMSYFVYANCGPGKAITLDTPGQNYVPPVSISVSANSIISKLGILGKMYIANGGTNYNIGDWIFFDNTLGSSGAGAIANVTNVAANGMITEVKFQQMKGHPIGGSGYDWLHLPSANIRSSTGSGANIAVTAIIGHNEEITQSLSNIGTIQALTVISGGSNYTDTPYLALDLFGDGTANASITALTGVFSYPGRYVTDDGHLSSYNFLENRDYYQDFSYVVRIDETINKYRAALKTLVHPAGTKLFGEYTLVYDQLTKTNTNLSLSYANTLTSQPYKSLYQVQGYTPGIFAPNVVTGIANAEFVVGSYSMNIANYTATYSASNNSIVIYAPGHTFYSNTQIFLQFSGANTNANVANQNYLITGANASYLTIYNPKIERADGNANTGIVKVSNPSIFVTMPHSRANAGSNAYLQFQTVDPLLANGFYYVVGVKDGNTFNIVHPNMSQANDAANVANLITHKIVVVASDHEFVAGQNTFILLLGGDTANTKNGYYTIDSVKSSNTFNIIAPNIIFSGSTSRVYQKRSKVIINNHPYANGTNIYITFANGDQGNTVNGIYMPIKIGANEFTFNVARPASANTGVRVWYQGNNYSNIVFQMLKQTTGLSATNNTYIEFKTSAADISNGIYMLKTAYNANSFNIYYDANTYITTKTNNLLLNGNTVGGTSWGVGTTTVATNSIVAPDGTTTASSLTATSVDSIVYQFVTNTVKSKNRYVFSVWLKSTANTNVDLVVDTTAGGGPYTLLPLTVTTSWKEYSLPFTANGSTVATIIGGQATFNTGEVLHAWNAKVLPESNTVVYSGAGVIDHSMMEGFAYLSTYK